VKELGLQGFVALLLLTVAIMAVIYRRTVEHGFVSAVEHDLDGLRPLIGAAEHVFEPDAFPERVADRTESPLHAWASRSMRHTIAMAPSSMSMPVRSPARASSQCELARFTVLAVRTSGSR
jgi:hypothetical protein